MANHLRLYSNFEWLFELPVLEREFGKRDFLEILRENS